MRQRCLEKSKSLPWRWQLKSVGCSKRPMQVMSGEDPKVEVNKLAWKDGSTKRSKTRGKQKASKENKEQVQKCGRCGYNVHKPQDKCHESCQRCKKIGHFAQVCRSKTRNVNLLNEMHYPSEDYSMNNVLTVMCNCYT